MPGSPAMTCLTWLRRFINVRLSPSEQETVTKNRPEGGVRRPCFFPRRKRQPSLKSARTSESTSLQVLYFIWISAIREHLVHTGTAWTRLPAGYLRGGLLPRPGPDGLPVLLGPFSRWFMFISCGSAPEFEDERGPEAYPRSQSR